MPMEYTVTVTDWTQRRGYRNSGRGWRVRCFGLPSDDFNSLGHTVAEAFYSTERGARLAAARLAETYNTTVTG